MLKRYSTIGLVAFLFLQPVFRSVGQVSLTALNVPVGQDFNTLARVGISSTTPAGWVFLESGASANVTYVAASGTGNGADTFSFGASGNAERAFGQLRSATLISMLGASFINNTGATITDLHITYTGEQWRLGALNRIDRLDFQYSLDATSLSTGTWTDEDLLDFIAPKNTAPLGALNGNDTTNRKTLSLTFNSLSLAPGETVWIRWTDLDAAGSDDGLAIDDFSITAFSDPPEIQFIAAADSVVEGDSLEVFLTLSRRATVYDTVLIHIGPADATYGDDYTTRPAADSLIELEVAPGDSILRFTVSTIDDIIDEPVEHIRFTIVETSDIDVGNQNTFILGIVDNDLPTIRFEVAADSVGEGQNRTLRVLMSSVMSSDVSVTIKLENQGHSAHYRHHQDYTTSPAAKPNGKITLIIPAGSTEATFELIANQDKCEEGDETTDFKIVAVSGGVRIGSPSRLTVTIKDVEPCRPVFVLCPNPTHGRVEIWTLHANRDKVIEGALIDSNGTILVSTSGTVEELGEAFTKALTGSNRGFYIVKLTMCDKQVNLRLLRL